ncbi:MAG: branched-chain amino acid aminotransferase [Rhizobiales bacterium]|nr:branched-chain amino acid aminotransferase [Hyphomicrobiales bacterium]
MAYKEAQSRSVTFFNGAWHEGNPMIMGPMTHAPWLGSGVFDGARAFEGVAPDLDLHCQRIVRSAQSFGLKILKDAGEIEELIREGIAKFQKGTPLYLRPMFWAESGFVDVDPESTEFSVSVYDAPLPEPNGFSVTLSPFRRPSYEFAPTDAKAACHYPNSARVMREARTRGFDNAVMLDAVGSVSELATANIWYAKDGEAHTPIPNGTFLNGITRQRTIKLLRAAGITVHERAIPWRDFVEADEVFSTGNYAKVVPITRIEQRNLQPGPIFQKARELYWDYAHGTK